MLLLPGVAMIAGGIAHKEQRFNKNVAGISSILLLVAVSGTIFLLAKINHSSNIDSNFFHALQGSIRSFLHYVL